MSILAEDLDTVVVEVRHDDVAVGVDRGIVGPRQLDSAALELVLSLKLADCPRPNLGGLRTAAAELCYELARRLKDVDSGGLVVHHHQFPATGHRHTFRPQQLAPAHLHHNQLTCHLLSFVQSHLAQELAGGVVK